MVYDKNLILGGGIAGLAAGTHLNELGEEYLIVEKATQSGGLCASFSVDNFIFDYFIHLSFTNSNLVRKYFDTIPYYTHIPNPCNYYHGIWIKHPSLNNLFPLSKEEKYKVLLGLSSRDKYKDVRLDNYEYWLRYQFGDYFAENFPLVYTRKYWTVEAKNMETKWVGNRIYQPTIEEIREGMNTSETPVTYYAKEMRYPVDGGYAEYLKSFTHVENIKLDEKVVYINPNTKVVKTDRSEYSYEKLYNSIPLPELIPLIDNRINGYEKIMEAVNDLHWTSGYIVSVGCRGEIPRNDLWDYVYDEDIDISRFYSPSLMSANTVPDGHYSIQAEIYTKDGRMIDESTDILNKAIEQLDKMGVLRMNEVVVKDIRFVKYCNIIFDHNIYSNRDYILNFLDKEDIVSIGRFGRWDYLWSDQAFLSGYNSVE